ncbi:MAG: type I restriction-modification system, N6-adenine DNA methyltransferase (M) subunit [Candidatus Malacoplasma girerdii]|nr:MAG: type I restriction-modification system, N6-adenine DNA methyltransferase (M) subunit [Candidatus Malacoplasma girerdii]
MKNRYLMNSRNDIVNKVGSKYLRRNIEEDEFSYPQVLKKNIEGRKFLDLRFEKDNVSLLIEVKEENRKKFTEENIEQIHSYKNLERQFRQNNDIVEILYDLKSKNIIVWKNDEELPNESTINSMDYYVKLFSSRANDKNAVIEATNDLNNMLHGFGVKERIRSQLVGSLLIVLNHNRGKDIFYSRLEKTRDILRKIETVLEDKIKDEQDDTSQSRLKIDQLIKVIKDQEVRELKIDQLCDLLDLIKDRLIPYIDPESSTGEDLLNLFFTTFNKYVGKADKNQAFTPTHITDFMCDIVRVDASSRVLDPTCGSGAFLVQAMSKMIKKAKNNEELKKKIKREQLFGIEKEEKAFGLATTNMLIHQDGRTNIICDSCFNRKKWIQEKKINVVLMNPPFNGQKMPDDCPKVKNKEVDATKGFYFVKYIADTVNNGWLATILPLQCAIGNDKNIFKCKKEMLNNHTLKAVFTLPSEVFYPGASVNACIMLFELGKQHDSTIPTFFGYYKEDGFVKKKNKGRIEKINWEVTKAKWLKNYFNNIVEPGLSIVKCVDSNDEWLAEAHMETDYSKLTEVDFVQTIRDFIAFKVKEGHINE